MKAKTGLKTVNGVTSHCPQIVLFWDDAVKILDWLPEGSELYADLERFMAEAKATADKFNQQRQDDEEQWLKTGRKAFEV